MIDPARAGVVRRVAVAEEGGRIAHRKQPRADDRAAARAVDDLVDLARLELRAEPDIRIVRRRVRAAARESPLIARDRRARATGPIADGQDGVGVIHIGGGIGLVNAVGEQLVVGCARSAGTGRGSRPGLAARPRPALRAHRCPSRPRWRSCPIASRTRRASSPAGAGSRHRDRSARSARASARRD